MKIVDKSENKKVSPEEMYQVGNVIKNFNKLFMVVKNDARNGDKDKYILICLTDNEYRGIPVDSLKELVKRCYSRDDELVNVELVIK